MNGLSRKIAPSIMFYFILSLPNTTVVPYANSLNSDETSSMSASHPDQNCWTLWQQFNQLWALWKLTQTRNLAEDNLFGGLRVNHFSAYVALTLGELGLLDALALATWMCRLMSTYTSVSSTISSCINSSITSSSVMMPLICGNTTRILSLLT